MNCSCHSPTSTFHTETPVYCLLIKYSSMLVWNLRAASCRRLCPLSFVLKISAPSSSRQTTASRAPELAANNIGVLLALIKIVIDMRDKTIVTYATASKISIYPSTSNSATIYKSDGLVQGGGAIIQP